MRRPTLLALAVLALAAGCGSDDDAATTVSAGDVESALQAQLSQDGDAGRVVDLGSDPPKQITCTKGAGSGTGWRCTITSSKSGENYLCLVEANPQTGKLAKTNCARIDT